MSAEFLVRLSHSFVTAWHGVPVRAAQTVSKPPLRMLKNCHLTLNRRVTSVDADFANQD
jgi:hypothetical protein